jgi:hypothetical protein
MFITSFFISVATVGTEPGTFGIPGLNEKPQHHSISWNYFDTMQFEV